MHKSHKKTESYLVRALTEVCEEAKFRYRGFSWLTHQVRYPHFPSSLIITCVFETDEQVQELLNTDQDIALKEDIVAALHNYDLDLLVPSRHITLDSEQACVREHKGNWKRRLGEP
ncbi:Fis family transcriptional regulator [Lacimicrobium sp. SS2-24]|uniref:Fis family transcriptional regulator n=1 Tax=Lacimicrobium sp. SS2-24 TaxID=2005569 RepID=UPI000B4AC629|nr:Fis family transcriptional regulator [Lacimicrobium sp. SS2-24]